MRERKALSAAWGRLAVGALLLIVGACAALPPNSFLDPTRVGTFGLDAHEGGIRRILSPRETPPGPAGASEPTPEDLVPTYAEYRFQAGDVLNVTILDLFGPGQPLAAALEINPQGEIRIPELGSVRASGLTEQELELEMVARLREAGLLPRAIVVISPQLRRGRLATVLGAIRSPGAYPISDPDMRVLDLIGLAGDADANARRAYIIRRGTSAGPPSVAVPLAPVESEPPEKWVVPPPVEVPPPAPALSTTGGAQQATPSEPPSKAELQDVLAPSTAPTTGPTPPPQTFPPIVFDPATGHVLTPEPPPAAEPPPPVTPPPGLPPTAELEEPFDWEHVPELGLEQRVIEIDLTALRAGDPRFNVVLRDRDVLNIPVDTGVFYLMGEVSRPGVYAFGGREITVKQALAISGGFGQLAWPQRCELIRREPGTDKQVTRTVNLDAIFAGLEDDFLLRDDDILNVGTHVVAPFLFVIRNSFRFTYGFGFVYDRNFADVDSYNPRANPETVDQLRRQTRGLPF